MRRRWLPDGWGPRWRGREFTPDALQGLAFVDDTGIVLGLLLGVVLVALTVILLPALVLIAEVVLAAIVLGGGVIGRVVLRRPWRIVARRRTPPTGAHAWHVTGFLRSRRAIGEIRAALREGRRPEPTGARSVALRPEDS